ncbi:hypothetical protein HBI56_007490 [Parastagonospora nodorum]|uniref:Uncharacterized protein n=1 Tax=Phaeosphaeria nodorum (strain SN15 / ATCC MYA-4574 / FGSC 10173) TaxID=321614 RepID=A0A7U2HUB3_PHANO|nr:hypothetical protein HBH56_122230 [Parastagonospora nodorum]QRC91033.1 hypothetical protein JI435_300310 [Parastagonospora nodorum SN15]KAH3935228.1 hypothetical protein HBH54_047780 [Parastagonospora nodorum]KAH3950240.1 hypothetical protein HBH53_076180 [Parastagonospora nodorum]KAH3986806.1 hypothetical protein HBH51_009270 [Parastagonospora nodorum]
MLLDATQHFSALFSTVKPCPAVCATLVRCTRSLASPVMSPPRFDNKTLLISPSLQSIYFCPICPFKPSSSSSCCRVSQVL